MFKKTYFLKKKNKKIFFFKNIYNNIYFLKKFHFMKSLRITRRDFLHIKKKKFSPLLKRLLKFKLFKNNIKPYFNQQPFLKKKKTLL